MVKDTIYKITLNGTYFFHKSMGSRFEQIYKTDSIGQPVTEDLYALADGIYRYDTFKGSEEEEEIDLSATETVDWDAIDNDGDELVATRAGTPEPNYNSFPVFSADRHTWFGKGLKEGLKSLNRMYGSAHVPNDYDKIKAALIADRSSILIIPKDEKRIGYNTKSMTHVFAKKVHFMITINPLSLPSNVGSWVKTMQGTLSQEYPKLEKGEAIICGRLGTNWRGMKIVSH